MINATVARRYAQALLESGRERGDLERLEADLVRVVSLLEQEPGLRKALQHPFIPKEEKKRLVEAAFRDQLSPVTLRLLTLLVEKKRVGQVEPILTEFKRLANESRSVMEAEAVVAKSLDDKLAADLRQRLREITGKRVELKVTVDQTLIGGIVLKVGDRRIDGSLRGRLARMREILKEGAFRPAGPGPEGGDS